MTTLQKAARKALEALTRIRKLNWTERQSNVAQQIAAATIPALEAALARPAEPVDERKAFEEWASGNENFDPMLEQHAGWAQSLAWSAWQARAAMEQKP